MAEMEEDLSWLPKREPICFEPVSRMNSNRRAKVQALYSLSACLRFLTNSSREGVVALKRASQSSALARELR
jgi:hypothetical protein